ncbi:MAG: hypothetical protein IBX41_05345 [Methanophagales archaeon]|nr:hypothetical protein [Methanophagales archaeon]
MERLSRDVSTWLPYRMRRFAPLYSITVFVGGKDLNDYFNPIFRISSL